MPRTISRRQFQRQIATASAIATLPNAKVLSQQPPDSQPFALKYMLASCMYGYTPLAEIVPEVNKIGASAIDLWPKVHGNQREQLDEMGEEAFSNLLKRHQVTLGCITQYKLGPFGLADEFALANRLGCQTIVTGGRGPQGLRGGDLKSAVKKFVEQLKPHLAQAHAYKVTLAFENHGHNLLDSPDSLRWLLEFSERQPLGIALAPYHLEQDAEKLAALIHELGNRMSVFYAWQYGHGCMEAQPKEQELLQLPGRGEMDFEPVLAALKSVNYSGWTEVFMHPFPRGIPILETTEEVTNEINRARRYLDTSLRVSS